MRGNVSAQTLPRHPNILRQFKVLYLSSSHSAAQQPSSNIAVDVDCDDDAVTRGQVLMITKEMLFFRNAVTDPTTALNNNAQQQTQMITALREDVSKLVKSVENGLEHKYVYGSDIKMAHRKKEKDNADLEQVLSVMFDYIKLHKSAHMIDINKEQTYFLSLL